MVYCLAPAQQGNLVRAAVELVPAHESAKPDHLVVGGHDLSVDQWRQQYGSQFDRVCDAVMAAQRPVVATTAGTSASGSDLLSKVEAVVLLVAGALVTLLAGGVQNAGTRRRLQAARLRTTTDNFDAACNAYLNDLIDTGVAPVVQNIRDRRQELRAALHETDALYPRYGDKIKSLLTLLGAALGDDSIQRGWELDDPPKRPDRAAGVRVELATLVTDMDVVSKGLERSLLGRIGGAKQ
jgi:hypothetical protein